MNNVNENKYNKVKLIKHFIKDLSFENPQKLDEHNSYNNENSNINLDVNVIYKDLKNDLFSLLLKFNLEGSSKKNNCKLFHLDWIILVSLKI